MSSWLARSLANSLKISDDDDEDDDDDIHNKNLSSRNTESHKHEEEEDHNYVEESSSENLGRGVKEDLSDLTKTLTRQLRGVASFLAPPPTPSYRQESSVVDSSTSGWNLWDSTDRSVSGETSDPEISDSSRIDGIRGDLYENVENSDLSIDKAINEIPRIDSPVLLSGSELSEDKYPIGGAVGVTDEVLVFARNIAMHPETWLDFPLVDDEEFDDFDMSDAQYEHALAIERLAPRFAALRIELCPRHMSQGCFWKVYFVLLHSRLNKHDAELLSTPQIVEGRAMWMRELQKRTKPEPEPEWLRRGTSYFRESTYPLQEQHLSVLSDDSTEPMPLNKFNYETAHSVSATDYDITKYPVVGTETRFIDKSVVEEEPVIHHRNRDLLAGVSKILDQKYDDDSDDWLEESSEIGEFSRTTIPLGHEEDVSFSDLEDEGNLHIISRPTISTKDTRQL
ncbi:BSD [Macleaya cordata]|uniref:BSD n=1 Tax=Macleaya cordata TaxID=56857 RepID=A0A200QJJ3_MACCD|nr:BSD [Macleaya cordata]